MVAARRIVMLSGIALAVAGLCADDASTHDALPQRAAVQSVDEEMAEWPAYRSARSEACESSDQAFTYAVGMHADDGTLDRFRSDVRYLCPERMDRLEETVEDLGDPDGESEPCTDE